MHGQDSLLSRDGALAVQSVPLYKSSTTIGGTTTNMPTTNHHQQQHCINGGSSGSSVMDTLPSIHQHHSTYYPQPQYERDHHHTTTTNTIPSLNTTMHYNNTNTTSFPVSSNSNNYPQSSSSSHSAPMNSNISSTQMMNHRLDDSHYTTTSYESTMTRLQPPVPASTTITNNPLNNSTTPTTTQNIISRQQQHHHPPLSSSSPGTSTNTTPLPMFAENYHPLHQVSPNISNNNYNCPPSSLSSNLPPFPYHQQQPSPHDNRSSSSSSGIVGQAIRTHASHSPTIPSPSSMMQTKPASLPPPQSPGVVSRASAYPPHSSLVSGETAASLLHPQPIMSTTRPVPSYQRHISEVDTVGPTMESQNSTHQQNLYSQQERNSKNPNVSSGQQSKNPSKQVEHKSCIICGKADTGNKYISYTINESNIEQYKGCFRHVPEIRIGDGVCKNCYAKKYKYVTGLSINKVKRKITSTTVSTPTAKVSVVTESGTPLSVLPPPPSPGSLMHAHARNNSSTNTNHHHTNEHVTRHHASYPSPHASTGGGSSSEDMYRSSKYYENHMHPQQSHHGLTTTDVIVPSTSPMHAQYSSTRQPLNNSPPQSPPSHASNFSRKTHHGHHYSHYHPYASSNEHHNQTSQYFNGTNSTGSGGSNSNGRGIPSLANHHGGSVVPPPSSATTDPFRSSPSHVNQQQLETSPKSPKRSTAVPSIMEMMGTAPPSYAIGSNQGMNVNSNRTYSNGPYGHAKHENANVFSHRYHPYGSERQSGHAFRNSTSGREDVIHSPRIINQEHLPKIETSPNPSPIRVASIVATGPALPGSTPIPHKYSPPPSFNSSREDGNHTSNQIPSINALQQTSVKMEEVENTVPRNQMHANVPKEGMYYQLPKIVKEEIKEVSSEPLVNVFLTFVTTTGTQSPTTRLAIPRCLKLNQLQESIHKRLLKNTEEENNMLQLGEEMALGNIMLKKDENNYIEIDEQFCAIYRFEPNDSLKVSLIK